jgi:hypothetical protein
MDFSARRLRFGENADSLAAHALSNSTPQLLARDRRAVVHSAQLGRGVSLLLLVVKNLIRPLSPPAPMVLSKV